jgi:RND family efflux transporter MFP subunit
MSGFTRGAVALAMTGVLGAGVGLGYWWGQSRGGGHEVAASASSAPAGGKSERKVLYYRNPMGLPDTSPTPKKDPMGMDYVPVYEGEDSAPAATGIAANTVRISADRVQNLGVRVAAVERRTLDRQIRSVGRVELDERRLTTVSPKFEGWIERLHVNATGQAVSRGQPLFEVYSPELVSAQREYAIAMQATAKTQGAAPDVQLSMRQLAESSLARLKNWDISDEQLSELASGQATRRTLTFKAPSSGVVTERKAVQGMRFMPGEVLYQIADLSSVWVLADVPEQDLSLVRVGTRASVRVTAYPARNFEARVTFVYPTMTAETRTVPVRLELANPGGLLKPSMFGQVSFEVATREPVLTVPVSAVIDSGARQIVLVQQDLGRFEPREIKLGASGRDYVEVLSGVEAGESVVVSANFLIDAESNLKAALQGLGHAGHGSAPAGAAGGGTQGAGASPVPTATPSANAHQVDATVEAVDLKTRQVTLAHGPVPSLKWPAMTMEFAVANSALLDGVAPGQRVRIEFVERKPGEWVVVKLTRQPAAVGANPSTSGAAKGGSTGGTSGHSGH